TSVTGMSNGVSYSYYVKCQDAAGNISGDSSISFSVAAGSSSNTVVMGENRVLSDTDSGNGNLLLVQDAVLSQNGTIQSLSFYVKKAQGNLRLGIYDATGPNGGPGKLQAQTDAFAPVAGWNTRKVTSPVALPAGKYWLAYFPSSNVLSFATNFSI